VVIKTETDAEYEKLWGIEHDAGDNWWKKWCRGDDLTFLNNNLPF